MTPTSLWRVGYRDAPCDFTPHHLYAWINRFDDELREYRTIYAADRKETCLREVLADLRPNKKAITDFLKIFGKSGVEENSFGVVSSVWRGKNVLAQVSPVIVSGRMIDVEDAAVLRRLEPDLAEFLQTEGIRVFNAATVRSRNRRLTQKISRLLFNEGEAGIDFHSHLDANPCHSYFEFRAELHQIGQPISLTQNIPEFLLVCKEYGLRLAKC